MRAYLRVAHCRMMSDWGARREGLPHLTCQSVHVLHGAFEGGFPQAGEHQNAMTKTAVQSHHRGTMDTEISNHDPIQNSVFIVSLR